MKDPISPFLTIRGLLPKRNSVVHRGRLIKQQRRTYALEEVHKRTLKGAPMKTVEDLNTALDAALEMTFPASDPIAVYIAERRSVARDPSTDIAPDRFGNS